MRDRLIELIKDAEKAFPKDKPVLDIEEFVADHLLANGVIVPPCKVGDTLYEIEKSCLRCMHLVDDDYSNFCECTLDDSKLMFECDFDKECCYDIVPKRFGFGMIERIGKTVFLTKEEAEKALAERSGK